MSPSEILTISIPLGHIPCNVTSPACWIRPRRLYRGTLPSRLTGKGPTKEVVIVRATKATPSRYRHPQFALRAFSKVIARSCRPTSLWNPSLTHCIALFAWCCPVLYLLHRMMTSCDMPMSDSRAGEPYYDSKMGIGTPLPILDVSYPLDLRRPKNYVSRYLRFTR